VLDRAGWHTGKEVEVPEEIDLEFLPSSSPELQPSERETVALEQRRLGQNRHFDEIEELEDALVERCVALSNQPEVIRS
jgi:hypothetical protein